jgi:hypothetical protein
MKASKFDTSRLVAALGACFIGATFAPAARAAPTSPGDDTAAQTDAQVDQASAELMEHHRHHHHGGVTQFIAMSLDTLGVEASKQSQVDKVQTDLRACMAPAREIENKLLTTLADGVASGTIDTASVDASVSQLDAAVPAVHDCAADPVNQLHAILSKSERATLVDKVQAHWDVWRQVNREEKAGGKEKGGRLAAFSQEMSLSADQEEQISAALQKSFSTLSDKFDRKKVDAQVQAFSTGFARKSFDAKALTANASGDMATCGTQRMVLFFETVTPLLTPDQRATLAQHLREHANQQVVSAGK